MTVTGQHLFLLFFICVFGLIGILGTIFWVWMIIDCATHEPASGQDKLVWILIIVLTHVLGASIYFFARRPTRIRTTGQ